MLFNSLSFLLFFPTVCAVYFAIKNNNWRNYFLLGASYYFYMCWEPVYALLLLASTAITYCAALMMENRPQKKKAFLTVSIVLNLAILFFFKYFNWAAEEVTALMDVLGVRMETPKFNVLLPVGISFYVFQALGYSIDVYRGSVKTEKNFFIYALFVSFFPQLVAGPIERSTNLLKQFYEKHDFNPEKAITGINLMLWGFFLKLVVADNLAVAVNQVYNNIHDYSGLSVLMASVLFCFQLYGDFAGYSYIAIGCSRVMGFKLMDNFLRPYFFSVSVQDFWKRNHISLTTWFMDYVYYPMVGASVNIYWWCFCIFSTFVISGFWHGANWTYVMSFAIFGFYLVICILKDKRQKKFEKKHNLKNAQWWLWLNRGLTFILVMTALIFFRANNIEDGFFAVKSIVTDMHIVPLSLIPGKKCVLWIAMLFVIEYVIEYQKFEFVKKHFLVSYTLMSIGLAMTVLMFGQFGENQFIYFQF
ncbi:MAG: MBOAT family protein [Bacteroidales bacterium]|nr:MBOAT family protein [Bacteroidales bacterium]